MKSKLFRGLVVAIVVFAITFVLYAAHFFDVWEWKTWDLRLRLFSARTSKAGACCVVYAASNSS